MMKSFKYTTIALIVGVLTGCGGSDEKNEPLKSEIQFIDFRTQWNSYFIGDSSLPFDDELHTVVNKLNSQTKVWLADHTLSRTGLWSDIRLDVPNNELGNQLHKTYQRLLSMARVYNLPGGEFKGNADLNSTIIESLELLNQQYYKTDVQEFGNWWNWQVGIPKNINDILLLMGSNVNNELLKQYINATRYFVPNPTHFSEGLGAGSSSSPKPFETTGANRIDNARVVLIRSVLENNENEFKTAIDAIIPVIDYVDDSDGFYIDDSFLQHKDIPYTGTYGNELIKGLGMMLGAIEESDISFSNNFSNIYPIIFNSFSPLMIDGRMMDFVNGRAISRVSGQNHKIGHSVIESMLLYVESAKENDKDKLKSLIKTQILNDTFLDYFGSVTSINTYQLAQNIVSDDSVLLLNYHKEHHQFPAMDRVVHHRDTWSFGIAMHSNRVGNYECVNGENLKGWYTSDGMNYLYNGQRDHYTGYFAIVDPYQLAGTTVLDEVRDNCSGQRSEQRDGRQDLIEWSGGTSLEGYGVAGFDFTNYNDLLKAKKSWFMFDDEIVALGSNIKNNSSSNARTIIENRKIECGSEIEINNVKYIRNPNFAGELRNLEIKVPNQINPISYVVLGSNNTTIEIKENKGKWSDIGTGYGALSNCFVTASINHEMMNDSYQYMIIPNASNKEGSAVAIEIIRNDSIAHAVNHKKLNILTANFWKPGSAGMVTALTPLSIMIKKKGDDIKISVSDPMHSQQPIKFVLNTSFVISDDVHDRVYIDDRKLTVDLNDLHGDTYTFSLKGKTNEL